MQSTTKCSEGGRNINGILDKQGRLDLRNENCYNWLFITMDCKQQLQVLLPHNEYDWDGCQWSISCSRKITIVNHEAICNNSGELLTIDITGNESMHWVALSELSNETPNFVIKICAWQSSMETTASAMVAIPILLHELPCYPRVYYATMTDGMLTLRVNMPFVSKPERGINLHFMFAKGLDVVKQQWKENERGEDMWVLDRYGEGCVQEITISASKKLKEGEYAFKIFIVEPIDDAEEAVPYAIVQLMVKQAQEHAEFEVQC